VIFHHHRHFNYLIPPIMWRALSQVGIPPLIVRSKRPAEYLPAAADVYRCYLPLGLPARGHGRKVDYYKVLEIKPNSNTAAIKKAYRQRAKTTHPDLNANVSVPLCRYFPPMFVSEQYFSSL
jgi:hypothetical protein